MEYQDHMESYSIAANLHRSRILAFKAAFDEAGDQVDRFQIAADYRDIFDLISNQDAYNTSPTARDRLIDSGAVTLLTSLITSDAAHRIVSDVFQAATELTHHYPKADRTHLHAVHSLVIATISLHRHFRGQEHTSLSAELIRAAEVLIDRTDRRETITDSTLAIIGFCINGILLLFMGDDDHGLWGHHWGRCAHDVRLD